jgi:enamine deaminase RidA (YjgF/YER057c/UK114 family)
LLEEAGAKPEHIVRMTWFVADKAEYLAGRDALGDAYRDTIGRDFPPMAVLEVSNSWRRAPSLRSKRRRSSRTIDRG